MTSAHSQDSHTATAPSAPAAPLAYAPYRRRRRGRRWAAAGLLLAGLAVAAWRFGPPYWRQGKYLWWQHRCMARAEPPDRVVYEDDPAAGDRLLAAGGDYQPAFGPATPSAGAGRPVVYQPRLLAERPDLGKNPVLFLHARRAPGGRERLVVVRMLVGQPLGQRLVVVRATAMDPASWAAGSTAMPINSPRYTSGLWYLRPSDRLRCFAGQPDPADPSHFTIRYERDGVAGTFHGRLRNDDLVALTVDGPLAAGAYADPTRPFNLDPPPLDAHGGIPWWPTPAANHLHPGDP